LPRFKIVDVGAMLGVDAEPYARLANAVPCKIIGFEPAAGECEKLTALQRPGHTYLPYAIGDGAIRPFHECSSAYMSSLFEPNLALLEKFQNLAPFFEIVRTHDVQTWRLDDIPETVGADFLKIDVQGAELLVLQGATERLKDVLVVHTEVEFLPMYKGQPLFADVDAFLRAQGFAFHKMRPWGRTFKPMIVNNNINEALSQVMWGDAIYVRDFMQFGELPPTALLKLAVILHENYQSCDVACFALETYDRKMGTGLQLRYLRELTGGARPPNLG